MLTVLQPFSYSRKSAGGPISLESNNCDLRGELTQVISENLSVVLASHKPNSDPNREPPLGNLHYLCPHSVDFRFGTGSNDYVYHVLKNRLLDSLLQAVPIDGKLVAIVEHVFARIGSLLPWSSWASLLRYRVIKQRTGGYPKSLGHPNKGSDG